MAPKKTQPGGPVPVDSIRHGDKRLNIPTADSEELLDEDDARPVQLRWKRDPSLALLIHAGLAWCGVPDVGKCS
jgi:adenine-specific DNA-methyltransferase